MNANSVRNQIKKAGIDTSELVIDKVYRGYEIRVNNLSFAQRSKMTGDQVNAKKDAIRETLNAIAEATNGEVNYNFVFVKKEG